MPGFAGCWSGCRGSHPNPAQLSRLLLTTLSQAPPVAGQMLPSPPERFLPVTIFNRPAKGRGTQPPTICSDSWDASRAAEPRPRRVLPRGAGRGACGPLIRPTSPPSCQPGLRPQLARTPHTAEPAGASVAPAQLRLHPRQAASGWGGEERSHCSFSFVVWLLPMFFSQFGDLERSRSWDVPGREPPPPPRQL